VWHLMCNLGSLNAAAAATLAVRSGMRHFSLFCACGLIIFDCDFQDQRRFAGKRETFRQIAAHDTITQRKNVEHRIDGKLHAPRLQPISGKMGIKLFQILSGLQRKSVTPNDNLCGVRDGIKGDKLCTLSIIAF